MDRTPDDLLRLLAERTADVYWTTNDRGILTYVAPQVVVLTGRQPNELIGAPLQALVCEEDFDEAASLQRAIIHERIGRMSIEQIATKMTEHEVEHAVEVVRLARMAPSAGRVVLPLVQHRSA